MSITVTQPPPRRPGGGTRPPWTLQDCPVCGGGGQVQARPVEWPAFAGDTYDCAHCGPYGMPIVYIGRQP